MPPNATVVLPGQGSYKSGFYSLPLCMLQNFSNMLYKCYGGFLKIFLQFANSLPPTGGCRRDRPLISMTGHVTSTVNGLSR